VLERAILPKANELPNTYIIVEWFNATCLDNANVVGTSQEFSDARAQVIVDYLSSLGIDENRLIPVGRGNSQPLSPCTGRDGCCIDSRRVYFHFVPAS